MIRHELIKATEEFLKQKFYHATEFEQPDIAYRIEHTYRVANIGREIALRHLKNTTGKRQGSICRAPDNFRFFLPTGTLINRHLLTCRFHHDIGCNTVLIKIFQLSNALISQRFIQFPCLRIKIIHSEKVFC